jgi:hypothetical protein
MTATTYPNGQVLNSTALTPTNITKLLQTLTCGMIGVNPPDYARVRVDWQTQGQPSQDVGTDICYVACVPWDTDYNRVRDYAFSEVVGPPAVLTQTWEYTKGWRVSWTFYGPNSEDNARAVRSALYMDYFSEQLSLSNLYPVLDSPEVVRAPEQYNAQWWERADYFINMYEQVTETINPGIATSVEIVVEDSSGVVADITVH